MRIIRTLLILVVLSSQIQVQAQTKPALYGPGVFLRGLQQAKSVLYTASIIKPTDGEAMRNISVEITLPPDAVLISMFLSRQIEYKAMRVSRSGAVTLIWQISRITSAMPLDTFSFTTKQPLAKDLAFYMRWQSQDGKQYVENFTELPPLTDTTRVEGKLTVAAGGYAPLNGTGVYAALAEPGIPLDVTIRILPVDFNPPAKLGAIWWCSLLEITGLPVGSAIDVIVPLRRPVAPFASLQLFQRSDNRDWTPLGGRALVTADGQYVMYRHPGGIVATGGSPEIQPAVASADTIPVEPPAEVVNQPQNPPPADSPPNNANTNDSSTNAQNPTPAQNITDGSSNTVIIGGATPANSGNTETSSNAQNPRPTEPPAVQPTNVKGSGGVIIVNAGTAPPSTVPTNRPAPTNANITDGSSNTVIVGEVTSTPVPPTNVKGSGGVIIVNAGTAPPSTVPTNRPVPTNANITDGSSNTVIVGEVTSTPVPPTSVSAGTALPTSTPTLNTRATRSTISDGSSNTIIIGEVTSTQVPPTSVSAGTALPTSTPTLNTRATRSTISDGSSNTIIIGEASPTTTVLPAVSPTGVKSSGGGIIIVNAGTVVPTSPPTVHATTPTITPTSTNQPSPVATTIENTPISVNSGSKVVNLNSKGNTSASLVQPFGAGGPRVEIFFGAQGEVYQCQLGRVNCVLLVRKPGTPLTK